MAEQRKPLPPPKGRLMVDEAVADARAEKAVGLMRVVVEVAGRKYDEDLAEQASVQPNVEGINAALETHAGRYAEWAMLEALAKGEAAAISGQIARLDSDIKILEATITLEKSGTGKVDEVKAMVTVDPRRLEMVTRRQVLEDAKLAADDNHSKIAVGRKTMEEKRETVVELARNWRQEMQGKLAVNADKFKPGGR